MIDNRYNFTIFMLYSVNEMINYILLFSGNIRHFRPA